jgi:ABC-type nitrate/sulfonate/bicarbonate transport system substrate-binding protein
MLHLKIGGVPEHFNLPWHIGLKNKDFEKAGIKLEWIEFKGGTGVMNAALRDGSIDMAVMLTEGIIYDIIKGNPSKLLAQYIETPLQWGIHTGINNPLNSLEDIFSKKIAISRQGSGSHLMPIIDASKQGKSISEEQFICIRNLEGALSSLAQQETDVFYWERFTTKPFVDRKILKYLGKSPTPWPCFVVVARNEVIAQYSTELQAVIDIVLSIASKFKASEKSIDLICKRHYLKEKDALSWMKETEWSKDGKIADNTINTVLKALKESNMIEDKNYSKADFLV